MRIISGSHRGRKLIPPGNLPVRPTTDMAKEALFNILASRIDFESVKVLDLFSGTGNISFEFASRGCPEITAVEQNARCADYIRKTAEMLDFRSLHVIRADVFSFLKKTKRKYDLIFADPPYEMDNAGDLPTLVLNLDILDENGLFVFEHDKKLDFSGRPEFMEIRNYSKVHFSFFGI